MKRLLLLAVSGLAAVVTTAVLVAPALGTSAPPRLAVPPSTNMFDLAKATLASVRFQRVEQAIAAGYVLDSACVSDPTYGGMGVHYANHALMDNPALDPAKPEILVYVYDRNGRLRLGALEYFRRAADQTAPIDESDKPTLFGQTFDGVMPAHAPYHGWHYDLHVWVWKWNQSGLFFPFNPRVSCPA